MRMIMVPSGHTTMTKLLLVATLLLGVSNGFLLPSTSSFPQTGTSSRIVASPSSQQLGMFQGLKDFFQELDNFMDDASARRLGNGAAFYGKRKSNFYGANDRNRKLNSDVPDPTEDYQAPNTGGYFQWMRDENGDMRPVTRMKKRVVERNMKFWDNVYEDDDKDEMSRQNSK